jgi:hypothetical protein
MTSRHAVATVNGSWSRELIGQIARDIGDEVICHIETMYPKATEAAPSTFSLSVRNKIINEIMSAIAVNDAVWSTRRKPRADEIPQRGFPPGRLPWEAT